MARTKVTLSSLKKLVQLAKTRELDAAAEMKKESSNPSVAPHYHHATARAEAFDAILSAMNGDMVLLKIIAGL